MHLAKAVYANKADTDEELSFSVGDVLSVVEVDVAGLGGWWLCKLNGRTGIAPGNRLQIVASDVAAENQPKNAPAGPQSSPASGDRRTAAVRTNQTTPPNQNGAKMKSDSLMVPRKCGNVFVYEKSAGQQHPDYDVPPARYANNCPSTTAPTVPYQPDYDVPPTGHDVMGLGDYDVPTPQGDPDGVSASSNRSSLVSVMSTGSNGSTPSVVFSQRMAAGGVGVGQTRRQLAHGAFQLDVSGQLTGSPRDSFGCECPTSRVSSGSGDASSSDSCSADSGISMSYGNRLRPSNVEDEVDGATLEDYDVPTTVYSTSGVGRPLPVTASLREPVRVVVAQGIYDDLPQMAETTTTTTAVPPPRVDCRLANQRDSVVRNVERFLGWASTLTSPEAALVTDAATSRQLMGQLKLAGLAVRTSLQELVDAFAEFRPFFGQLHNILAEVDRRLEYIISYGRCGSNAVPTADIVLLDVVNQLADIVATLPDLVQHVVNQQTALKSLSLSCSSDPSPSSSTSSSPRSMQSPQRPPSSTLSPPMANGRQRLNAPDERPVTGKPPPPMKPRTPKTVSWKKQDSRSSSPSTVVDGPTRQQKDAERTTPNGSNRPEELISHADIKKMATNFGDGWSDECCDYVSIVRQAEQEMVATTKMVPEPPRRTPIADENQLSDIDRELINFYVTQICTHSAIVDTAITDFYRCVTGESATVFPPAGPEVFLRRSRLFVLAAHKLVYVGDAIARHVTDVVVRNRVAAAANALCDQLKAVVMATKDAALCDARCAAQRRHVMVECVRSAADGCRKLRDVIGSCASAH